MVTTEMQERLLKNYIEGLKELTGFEYTDYLLTHNLTVDGVEKMLKHSVPLREVVDPSLLVNRHELKKAGIDPGSIRVVLGPESQSVPAYHFFVMDKKMLDWDDEAVYIVLAHELTHFRQFLSGDYSHERFKEEMKIHEVHTERHSEIDAVNWEAMQAARFGWTMEEYIRLVEQFYERPETPADFMAVAREIQNRQFAALPFIGPVTSFGDRRPDVRVRSYTRRA